MDASKLPKHFESAEAEVRWDARWQELGIHRYDPREPREKTFVVDTPPPTVSGSLHVGHVFSYTHTDVIVRYQRMLGKNIFYPMGWDDNGLPTERRVQNYFHVRCDPVRAQSAEKAPLPTEQASAKDQKNPPRPVSRPDFIELCHRVTRRDEKAFMALFRRIGLSVDWSQEYATIDDHCRRLAQLSFLDLHEKGHVYNVEAPTMWDVDFQTAVAQAEVEDRNIPGAYHHIAFAVDGSSEHFVIATTRPELLPACVGIAAHPKDTRYQHLFGKFAITPLFGMRVPIFATELADPEKGTGILMVCTFGDATDVRWWREEKLALRQIVGRDGRLMPIAWGGAGWNSTDPAKAERNYQELLGKNVKSAQKRIVELLREPGSCPRLDTPALQGEPKPIEHAVKFFEKGDRPLEIISTRQWFVRLMDKKDALLHKGDEIQWHPDFMRLRYRNWTENLQLDWCVSRQRYFGVPFPVWYPLDDLGQPVMDKPLLASQQSLPVDPSVSAPIGYTEAQRGEPRGFVGEGDVFDTWFTSSLTPQIGSRWLEDVARHKKLFPADIRPQSHEIIRTWAFYTIAKALLHENQVPWRQVVISGWILDPDRKKMSKSKGNVVTPVHLIDQYCADGVRYWAASAKLGMDTAFDENVLKLGRRLVTKLFNAGKFVLAQSGPQGAITEELDRGFVKKLAELVQQCTAAFEEFDFARALSLTESFFWRNFTDTYLELAKTRARGENVSAQSQASALATLRLGLATLLKLFAPFLPYITEEIWSWAFAQEQNAQSIHGASWPIPADFAAVPAPQNPVASEAAIACYSAINKTKSEAGVSLGRVIEHLTITCSESSRNALEGTLSDVLAATRTQNVQFQIQTELEELSYRIEASLSPEPQ